MRDDSAVVRQLAITALWEDSSTDLLDRLLDLLSDDPSADVRAEAAKALSRFAERAVIGDLNEETGNRLRARLLRAATDETLSPVIQRRAVESLGAFSGDQRVKDAIETKREEAEQMAVVLRSIAGRGCGPNPKIVGCE